MSAQADYERNQRWIKRGCVIGLVNVVLAAILAVCQGYWTIERLQLLQEVAQLQKRVAALEAAPAPTQPPQSQSGAE